MYPSAFEYSRPGSLDEALTLLGQHGDDAKVLAGGMSLIPLMKLRFVSPAVLVDLGACPGLDGIDDDGEALRVGALVRHATLAGSDLVRRRFPLMASAGPMIADPIVRNRGTLAGSLAHADPAGDWGSVMLALGASVVARSSAAGERRIPIDDLLQDTFTTSLTPTEVITEVRVPLPHGPAGGCYHKLERKVGDFATVGVAVQVELENGRIDRAGIALTAVGSRNIRAREAEAALAGVEPSAEAFAEAARLAAAAATPHGDVRGSADYKRHMIEVFTRRGLERGVELARAA